MLESLSKEATLAEISRNYDVNPNLINKWRQELLSRGHELFEQKTASNNPHKKIDQLEKLIGKQTIELEMAKNFLRHYSCR